MRQITVLGYINIVLFIILIGYGGWLLYLYFMRKKVTKLLDSEAFNHLIRHTQLIDIREKSEFNEQHILGARNIPFTEFKQRMHEIRKDQPIRLYGNGVTLPGRAALFLHKAGYENIFILKDGFSAWTGKVSPRK
ncbi:rhodanese-like domain-containing protein [Atopobacter phocae]|uniref:rhodanese-like domain-containing protein n=1 Tax=Atopobacter phocae TaxID=136492 RepID=UPI0004AE328C|nr:rhodanese-like domain-containing protein [Atopobacter phocae]